jgi:hypothetical protein
VLTRYMDGRKDGRTDRVIPIYPPNFVCGIYEKLLNSYICHSGCVVHNLRMCMKEYRCCLKFRRGDN